MIKPYHTLHNFIECLTMSIRQIYLRLNLVSLYRTRIAPSFADDLIPRTICDTLMNCLFAVRKF